MPLCEGRGLSILREAFIANPHHAVDCRGFRDPSVSYSPRPPATVGSSLVLLAYALTATATRSVNVGVPVPDTVSNVDEHHYPRENPFHLGLGTVPMITLTTRLFAGLGRFGSYK